jgi:hypothetical protein
MEVSHELHATVALTSRKKLLWLTVRKVAGPRSSDEVIKKRAITSAGIEARFAGRPARSLAVISNEFFRTLQGCLIVFLVNIRLNEIGTTTLRSVRFEVVTGRWLRRMVSFGMLSRVALVRTDVSVGLSASVIRVTRIGELGTLYFFAVCVGC